MKQIKEKLNELLAICESRANALVIEKNAQEGEWNNIRRVQSDLDERERVISDQEKELKKKKIAAGKLAEADLILSNAKDMQSSASRDREIAKNKLAEAEKVLEDAIAEAGRKKEKMNAEFAKLENEKRNYKKEIFDSMTRSGVGNVPINQ